MNKKGFTLIELLGVIVILSIVMLIAVPNVISILDKGNKDNYLVDAKKLITQAEYAIRNGSVNKPSSNEIYKITLGYLGTNDVEKDPDGIPYDLNNSYVVVVRKEGYLEYYVNLVVGIETTDSNGNKIIKYNGIRLVHEDELTGEGKLALIVKDISIPNADNIKEITGIQGNIKTY